jgi:hypothetical protein
MTGVVAPELHPFTVTSLRKTVPFPTTRKKEFALVTLNQSVRNLNPKKKKIKIIILILKKQQ